jgi:WD40 repeat protein
MEFSETFKISERINNSANSVLFSPNSRYICTSEFRQPSRRIGTSVSEILPSWLVRVFDAQTLALLHEYVLALPEALFFKHAKEAKSTLSSASNRQFLTGKRSDVAVESTSSAPAIGAEIELVWSPNSHFLAAWPVDVPIVFVCAPALKISAPLLRIEEQAAVNISSLRWTPDSQGLLTLLSFGMGIKYWRLDCKQVMHLFPYPKNVQNPLAFSANGRFMALLHRRDGVDHIAVYERNSDATEGDWSVVHVSIKNNIRVFMNFVVAFGAG